MAQIRVGLENNIDVSLYSKPEYTHFQMFVLRECLEKHINLNKDFTIADIFEIAELMYDIGAEHVDAD